MDAEALPVADGVAEYQLVFEDLLVKRGKKTVLSGVCGVAEPGKMLALMGPSGAGKSTLLNVLAGRSPPLTSGSVKLNGIHLNKQLKRKISYVLQEDIFFPRLTLRETLTYAALLKLPEKMSMTEKLARVKQVADDLEITRCLDTIIGDRTRKGLSGGEKKRTSIACELLSNPSLLMLDEPTSGLDSNAAYALMETLKNYAHISRKTVVASIHQPSSQVFFMFDQLLLLCDGQTAYFGDCKDILNYFASVDQHCEPNYNPADFILEKVKESTAVRDSLLEAARKLRYSESWPLALRQSANHQHVDPSGSQSYSGRSSSPSKQLEIHLSQAEYNATSRESVSGISLRSLIQSDRDTLSLTKDVVSQRSRSDFESDSKWPTTFFTQFNVLLRRSFKHTVQKMLSPLKFVEVLIISVFCGLIWFQLEKAESRIPERLGLCFFCTTYWAFGPAVSEVLSFPFERQMLKKERAAGYYRLSAFYFSKIFSQLPFALILPTMFVTIVYWMAGLQGNIPFYKMWAVLVLEAFTSESLGFFMAALITDVDIGLKSVLAYVLCSVVAGGYYVKTAPAWSYWLKYLSYLHYIFSAYLSFEFKGLELSCLPANRTSFCTALYEAGLSNTTINGSTGIANFNSLADRFSGFNGTEFSFQGVAVLDSLGLWKDEWIYPLALLGFGMFFQLMAYFSLRYLHRQ